MPRVDANGITSNDIGPRGAVVITGASTGIGKACALYLEGMGFSVFAGVRREEDGDALRAEAGAGLSPVMIDVTVERSLDEAAETVGAAVGDVGLAGIVNNAGIGGGGAQEFLSLDRVRQVMEVNYLGTIASTQAFLPLVRRGGGRVVNMGSIAGRMAAPFIGPYAASKHAVEAYTDSLRLELDPWGIHVAVIEPGAVATPIWEKGQRTVDEIEREMPEEALSLYGRWLDPLRRALDDQNEAGVPPEQVAKAVAHALTAPRPKTRYLVGRDAQLQAIIRTLVPDRLRDRLVRRQLNLPR